MSLAGSHAIMHAARPLPDLPDDAHKGDAGRVLCICGSDDMPGAAVLVARAAQRAGAGLVSILCTTDVLRHVLPVAAPESVLVDVHRDERGRGVRWSASFVGRTDHARVAGPGLGNTPRTRELITSLLNDAFTGPLVLDADGLNVIGRDLESLRRRRGPLVLTPHPGEASRLLGRTVTSDPDDRRKAALEISARANAVCCLKGHRTVIADGDRVHVNTSGNSGMATAGAGDVLCGILGAYLAAITARPSSEWSVFDATVSAVHLHGMAGDLAALERGRRGTIASDLIDFLPRAQVAFAGSSQKK